MKKLKNVISFIKTFDFYILSLALTLCCIGLVVILSATKSYDNTIRYIIVQSSAIVIG